MHHFITVCVGQKYQPVYVNTMLNMVGRHFQGPFTFSTVTDWPKHAFSQGVEVIKPRYELNGWWNKLLMFGPDMPQGRLVYIDLDVLIMNDITDIVTGYRGKYCGDEDHIHFGKGRFGSGDAKLGLPPINCALGTAFVMMESGHAPHVLSNFLENTEFVENAFKTHGDQVYTSWQLGGRFDLLEKLYPDNHGFCSYRFDVVRKGVDPFSQRLINFHGNNKPHVVAQNVDWVRNVWR